MGVSSFILGQISTIYQDTNPFIIFYIGGIVGLINLTVALALPKSLKHASSGNEIELTEKQLADVVNTGNRSVSHSTSELLRSYSPSSESVSGLQSDSDTMSPTEQADHELVHYPPVSSGSAILSKRPGSSKFHTIDLHGDLNRR